LEHSKWFPESNISDGIDNKVLDDSAKIYWLEHVAVGCVLALDKPEQILQSIVDTLLEVRVSKLLSRVLVLLSLVALES
jgi:hypothetical protein